MAPTFSVIVATFGRGRFIAPTLEAIAAQHFTDFEVLVVSDGPAAPELEAVVASQGGRFSLLQTDQHVGSQSGANNLGWSQARGQYIAYLGHDDVWHPDHLALLKAAYERIPSADFAVSGCVYTAPRGTEETHTWITGIFPDHAPWTPRHHFFPPSSMSHRRELPDSVERWPHPAGLTSPVDSHFMMSAVEAGCTFVSTRQITVVKFGSAFRYLSYLQPDDREQREALAVLSDPVTADSFRRTAVDRAVKLGNFMTSPHHGGFRPGQVLESHGKLRGLIHDPLKHLDSTTWLPAGPDARGFDWYGLEGDEGEYGGWRWSGPNPNPRVLIAWFHEHEVDIRVFLRQVASQQIADSLMVLVNGQPTASELTTDGYGWQLTFRASLTEQRPTVLEFETKGTVPLSQVDAHSTDDRPVGICLTGIELAPSRA